MTDAPRAPIPETHEIIRPEDIAETLDVFAKGNSVIPALSPEQSEWLEAALAERRYLCANQYKEGRVDTGVLARLQELDGMIGSVSPDILKVLHYLSRVRAIIPVLQDLQEKLTVPATDPNVQMVTQMQYECSKAEVKSAIEGLATLRVRPRILDEIRHS